MKEIISCIIRPGIYFHDKSATSSPQPEIDRAWAAIRSLYDIISSSIHARRQTSLAIAARKPDSRDKTVCGKIDKNLTVMQPPCGSAHLLSTRTKYTHSPKRRAIR